MVLLGVAVAAMRHHRLLARVEPRLAREVLGRVRLGTRRLAFLGAQLDIKAPTRIGDTIHVEAEVIEARLTSKGDRGLVRTSNIVVKQDGTVVLAYNPLRMLKRRG